MLARTVLLSFLLLFPLALHAATKPREAPPAAASSVNTPHSDYRLGTNDVIKLQVFGEANLTTETRVGGDGKVAFPLIGVLEVKGLTVNETEILITKHLADGYLKNPRVNVYITKYRNFYILGEVKQPGGYPYEDDLTLMKAAVLAGGFTEKAYRDKAKVKRRIGKQEQVRALKSDDPVFPDDVVVVPEDIIMPEYVQIYIAGEVRNPGSYRYQNNDALTVLKAIMLAGGFTQRASTNSISIRRHREGKSEEIMKAQLEEPVLPEDVIVVPAH